MKQDEKVSLLSGKVRWLGSDCGCQYGDRAHDDEMRLVCRVHGRRPLCQSMISRLLECPTVPMESEAYSMSGTSKRSSKAPLILPPSG